MTIADFNAARDWHNKHDALLKAEQVATAAAEKHLATCKHWVTDNGHDPATGRSETWCSFCGKEL